MRPAARRPERTPDPSIASLGSDQVMESSAPSREARAENEQGKGSPFFERTRDGDLASAAAPFEHVLQAYVRRPITSCVHARIVELASIARRVRRTVIAFRCVARRRAVEESICERASVVHGTVGRAAVDTALP